MSDLHAVVAQALDEAKAAGADEVKAWASRGSEVELEQRGGRLVKSTEATSRGLSLSLLVNERFSSHSTSDMRPDALKSFIGRAVDATRTLEPDPDRRLAPREQLGTLKPETLDLVDQTPPRSASDRRQWVAGLESDLLDNKPENLVSATVYGWEVRSETCVLFSNGYSAASKSTHFGCGGEVTLREDDGKLPEATAFFSARHLADVPGCDRVVSEIWTRAAEGLNSGPVASGRYPMLLANRSVGRFLGAMLGPMSGGAVWQGRSLFADKIGERIGAPGLTIWDEPQVARGLGSRLFDGDGFAPKRRPLIENGVLQDWLMDVYHARKLGREPTGGSVSNVVIEPGEISWQAMAKDLPKAIRVTSFLGGNSNSTSGEFSFGIRGQLLEHGVVVSNIAEMNVSGNLFRFMDSFEGAADDPWGFSAYRVPTLLFSDVQFSGS